MSGESMFTGDSRFAMQPGSRSYGKTSSLIYPSPMFDIAQTYLPTSLKQMFRWCRFYFLTNPVINAVIYKMAEYALRPLVFDVLDDGTRRHYEWFFNEILNYPMFQKEIGLDRGTYGNSLVSVHFPFRKFVVCPHCGASFPVEEMRDRYRWRGYKFSMVCPACNNHNDMIVKDRHIPNAQGIRLIRWDPEMIDIEYHHPHTPPTYSLIIPRKLRNDIVVGKPKVIETIPQVYVDAVAKGRNMVFEPDAIYHMKRPIIQHAENPGWGMPPIMPVLKDAYYMQILRKAQEAIAVDRLLPMRYLFPSSENGAVNPYGMTDLRKWSTDIEKELEKWRADPNYIPVLPLPIGQGMLGGEGKALLLHNEYSVWTDQIIMGLHAPPEFLKGGLSYSGSSVSLRMLENQFMEYINDQHLLLAWVIRKIARKMSWPVVKAHMKRFKMADDLQRTMFMFQLNQAQKISDKTLLEEVDRDLEIEEERKSSEISRQLVGSRRTQLAQATIQGESAVTTAKYNAIAQDASQKILGYLAPPAPAAPPAAPGAPGPEQSGATPPADGQPPQQGEMVDAAQEVPGMPEGSTISTAGGQQGQTPDAGQSPLSMQRVMGASGVQFPVMELARRAAAEIRKMDPSGKFSALAHMRNSNPQLHQLVLQILQQDGGSHVDPANPMQSALPEQKPPRRGPDKALI